MTLRQKLQPTITHLTEAIDYYSEEHIKGNASAREYYVRLVKLVEDLKLFILENERKDNEEVCLSSRSNGRLFTKTYDQLEDALRDQAESDGDQYVRSNS